VTTRNTAVSSTAVTTRNTAVSSTAVTTRNTAVSSNEKAKSDVYAAWVRQMKNMCKLRSQNM
jgi:hypothetical protein